MSTKLQANCLELIRAKLDVGNPGFRASDDIARALANADVVRYLDTYVFPLLVVIESGEGYRGQREEIARDVASVRLQAKRGYLNVPGDLARIKKILREAAKADTIVGSRS